jgi:dTDP-4-dehydrorhamnose 3,5-epimerase
LDREVKFHPQPIPGVYLIEPEPVGDARGLFRRHYCAEEFRSAGLDFEIRQTNFSENNARHTLRGLHYRRDFLPESKILTCVRGGIYNVVADLRVGSPTYLRWFSLEVNQDNRLSLFLPHGCANAFLTLRDDTVIYYCHSSVYQPGADTGVRYDDPSLKIEWAARPAVISEKDLGYPNLVPGEGARV